MKNFIIICGILLFALSACNGNKDGRVLGISIPETESVEITQDSVILVISEYSQNVIIDGGNAAFGGSKFRLSDGDSAKICKLKEQYDLKTYDKVSIILNQLNSKETIEQPMKLFDVYEFSLFKEVYLAKDVKGIALKQKNGKVLTLLVFWFDKDQKDKVKIKNFYNNKIMPSTRGFGEPIKSQIVMFGLPGMNRGFILPIFDPKE